MTKKIQLNKNEKFNRLTVVKLSHSDKRQRKHYLFKCSCGNKKVIQGSLVVSGNTKSCGCLAREIKKARRISKNHSEVTAIILGYKRHARTRGIEFLLSRADVDIIIRQDCFYCGKSPTNRQKTKNSLDGGLLYNGIDRVNSTLDYTTSNAVPCCRTCNLAKRDRTKQEFLDWITRVYNFQQRLLNQGVYEKEKIFLSLV